MLLKMRRGQWWMSIPDLKLVDYRRLIVGMNGTQMNFDTNWTTCNWKETAIFLKT